MRVAVQEVERGADRSWALQQVGFMLDENCYYDCLNTEQHLYLIVRMRGVPEEEIQTQAGTLRALPDTDTVAASDTNTKQ